MQPLHRCSDQGATQTLYRQKFKAFVFIFFEVSNTRLHKRTTILRGRRVIESWLYCALWQASSYTPKNPTELLKSLYVIATPSTVSSARVVQHFGDVIARKCRIYVSKLSIIALFSSATAQRRHFSIMSYSPYREPIYMYTYFPHPAPRLLSHSIDHIYIRANSNKIARCLWNLTGVLVQLSKCFPVALPRPSYFSMKFRGFG